MNPEKIGKFIKEQRVQNNLTQQELGDKLGISGKSISKWERGINLPDISILTDLSKIFHITTDELLNGKKLDKENNNNYFKKLFILTIILIITLLSFIIIKNYHTYEIYHLNSDNSILDIDGYLIFNYQEHILLINSMKYHGDIMEYTDNINIILKNNDDELINYHFNYQKDLIKNLINKTTLNIKTSKNYKKIDNLHLIIKFNNQSIKTKLRITEKLSNNIF